MFIGCDRVLAIWSYLITHLFTFCQLFFQPYNDESGTTTKTKLNQTYEGTIHIHSLIRIHNKALFTQKCDYCMYALTHAISDLNVVQDQTGSV